MKKNLLVLFLVFLSTSVGKFSAQISQPPIISTQKADDGVLTAYPNPAKDVIVVRSKDSSLKIRSVTFFSILGIQVADFTVNMNSAEIRLDRLRPGKYLMRYLLSNNTQKVVQIVKQ